MSEVGNPTVCSEKKQNKDWKWAHADLSSHKTESGARVQLRDGELPGLSKALGLSQNGSGGGRGESSAYIVYTIKPQYETYNLIPNKTH